MSPSLIGLAIGLLLGGMSYGMLKKLGEPEKNPKPAEKKDADKEAPKKHDHEGKP